MEFQVSTSPVRLCKQLACYNNGMPIHDWTRVTAGTFYAFHVAWIAELQRVLNSGVLPEGYYAQAEQVAGQVIADVLALEDLGLMPHPANADPTHRADGTGGISVELLRRVSHCRIRLPRRCCWLQDNDS